MGWTGVSGNDWEFSVGEWIVSRYYDSESERSGVERSGMGGRVVWYNLCMWDTISYE